MGDVDIKKDELWKALKDAGAGEEVLGLVSNVKFLTHGVIEIDLHSLKTDEVSEEESVEEHFYWDSLSNVYLNLGHKTAHAEASRAMHFWKPSDFGIDKTLTFDHKKYCWVQELTDEEANPPAKGRKRKASSPKRTPAKKDPKIRKGSSPPTQKKVSVHCLISATPPFLISDYLHSLIMHVFLPPSNPSMSGGFLEVGPPSTLPKTQRH